MTRYELIKAFDAILNETHKETTLEETIALSTVCKLIERVKENEP